MAALWLLVEARSPGELPPPPIAGIANDLLAIAREEEEQIEEAMQEHEQQVKHARSEDW